MNVPPSPARRPSALLRISLLSALALFSIAQVGSASPGDVAFEYAAPPAGATGVGFLAVQSDGKLLVGYDGADPLFRYNADGTEDVAFRCDDIDGKVIMASPQSTGKIVISGFFSQICGTDVGRVARLNADGTVDTTFPVAIEGSPFWTSRAGPDDSFLSDWNVGASFYIQRLTPDGFLVPGYDPFQLPFDSTIPQSVSILDDGSFYAILGRPIRVGPTGLVEWIFDTPGILLANTLVAQPDGKVVLGGRRDAPDALFRLTPDGLLDPSFSLETDIDRSSPAFVDQVSIDSGGRIIARGTFVLPDGTGAIGFARYLPDGRRDPGFDPALLAGEGVSEFAVLPDGDIAAALEGPGGFRIVRFEGGDPPPSLPGIHRQPTDTLALLHRTVTFEVIATGSPDPGYQWRKNGNEIPGAAGRELTLESLQFTDAGVYSVDVFNSEGLVESDPFQLNVHRPRPGQLDYSFDPQHGAGQILNLEILDTGKVLLGGSGIPQPTGTRGRLAVLEPDGAVDESFADPLDTFFFSAESMLVQPDGKVLTGGIFTYVERRNPDGSFDENFDPPNPCCEEPDARSLGLQSDGKILVWGRTHDIEVIGEPERRTGLVRLHPDGALDTTFPQTQHFGSLLVRADDKIYAQGVNDFSNGLVRMMPDGTDDPTFAADLGERPDVYAMAEQPDGKLVVVCFGGPDDPKPPVIRLNADGSRDPTFVPELEGVGFIETVTIDPNGKILIGGSFTQIAGLSRNKIARLYPDGALDLSFDPLTGPNNSVLRIRVQEDEQILIAGSFTDVEGEPRRGVARLRGENSSPKPPKIDSAPVGGAVQPGGRFEFSVISTVQPRPTFQWRLDGRDIVGATDRRLVLDRIGLADAGEYTVVVSNALGSVETSPVTLEVAFDGLGTGEVDPSFDAGAISYGFGESQVLSLYQRADESILVGGRFTMFGGTPRSNLVRISQLGALDVDFPDARMRVAALLPQPDDGVLLGGRLLIEPQLADGTVRPDWNSNFSVLAGEARSIAQQPDGKYIVGGDFDEYNLTPLAGLMRVNPDGSIDEDFTLIRLKDSDVEVDAVALQTDGKVLVGGEFGLARINSDGTLDETYDVQLDQNGSVEAILMLANGDVVIGGDFREVNGTGQALIAQLDSDGALVPTFVPSDLSMFGQIKALVLQPDGKILAGGEEFWSAGMIVGSLLRFFPDGTIDPSLSVFLKGGDQELRTMALQPGGRLLIGGEFESVNGVSRKNLARIFIRPLPVFELGAIEGEARYSLPTVAGRRYVLQASPDLAGPWVEVADAVGDGSILTLTHQPADGIARMHYRVAIERTDLR